ncbi:hypothetical protein KAT92_02635 [Candidatus Babeliales bacterium]|nr:hypothetical protein [Candidatus Babeliales bacterium]
MKKIFKSLLLLTCVSSTSLLAYAPTNFYRPHDIDFRLHEWKHNDFRIGAITEYGQTTKCRDWDENKRNVMQLYNLKESSVAMLLGAPNGSKIDKFAKSLGISAATATDDDYRGRFILTGKYEEFNSVIFAKYKLPINLSGIFELGVFVPIKSMEFYHIKWDDQTKDVLTADKEFKEEVSDQLETKAQELGGLNINKNGWSKSGIGDVIVALGWQRDFAQQQKEYLKNVRVNASAGISIPTGEKKDENQSFSLPLGNDGAWGIPMSLGLDLDFVYNFRAGFELDFFGLFDTTRTYRMKTFRQQTDFLLLHKGEATKSQGATWRFHLFGQAKRIVKGFSALIGYEFLKHDEDRLSPKSYDFSYHIVNSAESLHEWNVHNFVFELGYDPFGQNSKFAVKPHMSFFYKMPVTGKRVITTPTFGGQVAFSF